MNPVILAVDPGYQRSAWLAYNPSTGGIRSFAIDDNEQFIRTLRAGLSPDVGTVVIEQIESFGMAVGREVFETIRWAGRFEEAVHPTRVAMLPRRTVKTHLCGSARAKDANIRQALLDRFGGTAAIGRKAAPGPLHGISKDVWSALAIAITWTETEGSR